MPNRPPIYTSPVTPALKNLDWRAFLARPALAASPVEALAALAGQTILITGAGGSIGSALALRLAALGAKLVLLEASEGNLYTLLRDWPLPAATASVLGSVTDRALLDEIFAAHAPQIVFHAAAFKHVPLMEEQPLAAIGNNVFGTETLTRAAHQHCTRAVLLSTDKAVEPASAMGATKRVAEQIVLSAGGAAVRLGNVLASRGSVAEVFAQQIAAGGPVTVTDPAARRYFLTLDEAVNLLLGAALFPASPAVLRAPSLRQPLGARLESHETQPPSALLAPALPATHTITGLAAFMARELAPGKETPIHFTGLRAGDKETELLWGADEQARHAGEGAWMRIETSLLPAQELQRALDRLRAAHDSRDLPAALAELQQLVPAYTPSAAMRSLAAARVCA